MKLNLGKKVGLQLVLWAGLMRGGLWGSLVVNLCDSLRLGMWRILLDSLQISLRNSLRGSLWHSLGDSLSRRIGESVRRRAG